METFTTPGWSDYRLLASGDGERLEQWGSYTIVRPDPQIIWPKGQPFLVPDAYFDIHQKPTGWKSTTIPGEGWTIAYDSAVFRIKLTPFRHLGLFPEQAIQWEWLKKAITEAKRPIKVLNVFAYTGAASIICAQAGASVCHVDASSGSVRIHISTCAALLMDVS